MRIQAMILDLEKLDSEHIFYFQAGVELVGIEKNKKNFFTFLQYAMYLHSIPIFLCC